MYFLAPLSLQKRAPFFVWMNPLQQILDCLFQRAIVSVSYTTADKLAQHLLVNQGSAAFSMLVLALVLLPLPTNECLQTTLIILFSKLITHRAVLPMETQTAYLILPTIAFYLLFCAMLCAAVAQFMTCLGPRFTQRWDQIVPYVVVFCTSVIIRSLQQRRQIHFLYFAVLSYPLCAPWLQDRVPYQYVSSFTESVISRGVVLLVENYVFGRIHKADIALSFFYMCIIVCVHYVLQPRRVSGPCARHIDVCLGVLMYSCSSHLLQTMQMYCNHELSTTFAFTASLLVLMLYPRHLFTSTTIEFCVNSLSILWSGMLNVWIFHFYHKWEPLFIYFMVFVLIHHLQSLLLVSRRKDSHHHGEIVLVANEMEEEASFWKKQDSG